MKKKFILRLKYITKMGAKQTKTIPTCSLTSRPYTIETLPGSVSSKSPSEFFIVNDGKKKMFVKMWVSSKVSKKINKKSIEQKGLEYEGKVYNRIRFADRPSGIFEGISVSVLPIKHYYEDIHFGEVLDILQSGMETILPKQVEYRLLRSTMFLLGQGHGKRPKLTYECNDLSFFKMLWDKKSSLNYGMIVSEYISSKTFNDFMTDCKRNGGELRKWIAVYKILEKLNDINNLGIFHQDLWLGNILWKKVKDIDYFYIYDFDRAYDINLGDNPLLKTNTREGKIRSERQGQYNRVKTNSSKDFVKFLCHITEKFYSPEGFKGFSDLVFETGCSSFDEHNFKTNMMYHGVFRDMKGDIVPMNANIRDCLIPKILYKECDFLSRTHILRRVLLKVESLREVSNRIKPIIFNK